jgi:hypothetical protein
MANSMSVHVAIFVFVFFVECCKCTVLETNVSTGDTRGQSQVHCTRQGATADAKEPLTLYF